MVRQLFIIRRKHIDHPTVDNTTHARNKTTDQTYDLIYDNTEVFLLGAQLLFFTHLRRQPYQLQTC